jgi:hypothetical protein
MGITDTLATVGNAAVENTGNIEKAIIEILDLRDREAVLRDAVRISEGGGLANVAGNLNTGLVGDYLNKMQNAMDVNNDVADAYFQKLASKKKIFTVQFNPSTLRLSGHSGGPASTTNFSTENAKEVKRKPVDASISMSVELLFDSMDPKDAFMNDKIDVSPTGFLTGMADMGLTMGQKKKKTVQRQVEGFIGALRNENTRLITFNWGKLCYSGVLRRVGAEYTMFNVTGEPVRAKVGLTIMCADVKEWPNSVAVWQERYKNSYLGGSESGVKASQKLGSLLNF